MRTHSSIIARLITLAFLLLCVAPTGLGAGGLAGSARAAAAAVPHSVELLVGQPQLQGLHQAMKPWTLTLQTTAALTPTATLTISPTTFAPGDEIKVQGAAFAGGERIAISLVTSSGSAAVPIGITRADKAGNFGPMTIRVPFNAPAGQILVVASGQRPGQRATVVVTVHATIATLVISPTAAKPGEAITVTGTHFQPGESVAVDLVALASSARLGTTQANAAGSFGLHAIVPANTPQGTLNAVATGAASHISSTAPITIGSLPAGLTIGSGSVKAGETLSVSGKGFIPGETIGTRTVLVNPLRRGNIKLNDVLPSAEVATILTSNVPVVVERPDYNGPANLGLASSGSVIFGSNGGGLSWALPGGSTADGTQSRIFLFNPGLTEATVHATFYSESGAMVPQDLTLPPNSDTVLNVNTVPGLAAGQYGAVLKSTNNQVFLAEQSELNTRTQQATSTQGVAQ